VLGPDAGGWQEVDAPSAVPFSETQPMPRAPDQAGIARTVAAFRQAAVRALEAGFRVAEIHVAHGYLLHEFRSPLSNHRTHEYGDSFANRIRIVCETVAAVRSVWPDELSLFMRVSASDWVDGQWTGDDIVELAGRVADLGVDVTDCSSAGNTATAPIPLEPGYQVPFAERVPREAGVTSAAVGRITAPAQAEDIVAKGRRTSCSWPGGSCAIPTGRCMPPRRSARRSRGRSSTSAPASGRHIRVVASARWLVGTADRSAHLPGRHTLVNNL
jgi:2,4-dienoyl-CoA reductase-like NADH-dependent reductase (Old Yellow Enzyme family)